MAGSGGSQAPSASPSSISPAIVCCMCGDLGLPEQLFRCKSCIFRSQHKYCSELYPKAEAYSNCNWCLREARGKSIAGEPLSDGSSSSSSSGEALLMASKLQRGVPLLHLTIKPVKKLKLAAEGLPPASKSEEKEKSSMVLTGSGRVIRQPFRGKVRRYKLLEEVSS
ncbi:hypothetical protein IEQ34_017753 [Dendrobium chrysotoxum]|uniref:PHD-type zinc finger plants domain-containing protein n=1 Tax=Dendrobium chrysotoxum TaxID=161865 RepID=A0AAV7GC63_DENCH|nr:hypothetical protein IEQ34_017753 [Dendrobium chrysotoxum]